MAKFMKYEPFGAFLARRVSKLWPLLILSHSLEVSTSLFLRISLYLCTFLSSGLVQPVNDSLTLQHDGCSQWVDHMPLLSNPPFEVFSQTLYSLYDFQVYLVICCSTLKKPKSTVTIWVTYYTLPTAKWARFAEILLTQKKILPSSNGQKVP